MIYDYLLDGLEFNILAPFEARLQRPVKHITDWEQKICRHQSWPQQRRQLHLLFVCRTIHHELLPCIAAYIPLVIDGGKASSPWITLSRRMLNLPSSDYLQHVKKLQVPRFLATHNPKLLHRLLSELPSLKVLGWNTVRRPSIKCVSTKYSPLWLYESPDEAWEQLSSPAQIAAARPDVRNFVEQEFVRIKQSKLDLALLLSKCKVELHVPVVRYSVGKLPDCASFSLWRGHHAVILVSSDRFTPYLGMKSV
jgi:hypothetical protein